MKKPKTKFDIFLEEAAIRLAFLTYIAITAGRQIRDWLFPGPGH